MLELADSLPEPGEVFAVEGYEFRVQSIRGRRIAMLRVSAPEPVATDDDGETVTDAAAEIDGE